ncbi:MAG: C-GCAxxG-C-C family protein [Oscillospiraceae bacterium]
MNHRDKAIELFKCGYNCSQAVFGAFCEELGMDFDTAMRISSSFGGGIGRMREVCGAVSGMCMAIGLSHGYSDPTDSKSKSEHYRRIQTLAGEFKEKNGSIICRELLGLNSLEISCVPETRTEAFYAKRPCAELIGFAAELTENYLMSAE